MTTPPLQGTRYGPYAYPLDDLAGKAVQGHQAIAEAVASWAQRHHDQVALERAERRARLPVEAPAAEPGA